MAGERILTEKPGARERRRLRARGYRTIEDITYAVSIYTGGRVRGRDNSVIQKAIEGQGKSFFVGGFKVHTLYPFATCVNAAIKIAIERKIIREEKARELGYPVDPPKSQK